jgi:protease I
MEVLFIIAQDGFRDEEYLKPKDILEGAGVQVTTASQTAGTCTGALGAKVESDLSLSDVDANRYDAVVVIGGPKSPQYLWDNQTVEDIVKSIHSAGKVVASICLSGAVLAKACILEGRKATVFETPETINALVEGGAEYVREPVVADGRVITAQGPQAAESFGHRIIEALKG